jgi:uncharacterized membrane protein YeaQ/YmgE (transglycosylase-associated protein family)
MMDVWGYVLLVAGALVIGLIAEYVVRQRFGYEWLATAIGAGIGGFVASEYLGAFSDWGPEREGLAIYPAIVGALVVGVIVEVVMHYMTNLPTSSHGTPHPPMAR